MWEICANKVLPKAFKSCPKSNKSPDLVTLLASKYLQLGSPFERQLTLNLWKSFKNLPCLLIHFGLGSGCGSVGKAVASNTRSQRLKSSHEQNFRLNIFTVNCKNKRKMWPGKAHLNNSLWHDQTESIIFQVEKVLNFIVRTFFCLRRQLKGISSLRWDSPFMSSFLFLFLVCKGRRKKTKTTKLSMIGS